MASDSLQQELLDQVSRLGRARSCLSGERKVLFADADHEVAQRGNALVFLSRDGKPVPWTVPPGYRDVLNGAAGAALYLPADDACWERLQ